MMDRISDKKDWRLAVVGSRSFTDVDLMTIVLMEMLARQRGDLTIISGDAEGAETIAEAVAESLGIKTIVFRLSWSVYGKRARFIKNKQIVDESDAIAVFYGLDGESRDAAHTLRLARFEGMPNWVYYEGEDRND